MQTLQIEPEKARLLYKTASVEFKSMLEDTFGIKFFNQKTIDIVKSFEDACRLKGTDPNKVRRYPNPVTSKQEAKNAVDEIEEITEAIVGNWEADYNNPNQRKYYPVFIWDAAAGAFRFFSALCVSTTASAGCGARHVFETEEQAIYVGKQFIATFNKFLIKHK